MRLIVDRSTRRRGIAVKDHGHPFLKTAGLTVAGVCAGMVTEYLMDPERGRARRAKLRDRSAHAAHGMNGGLNGLSRGLQGPAVHSSAATVQGLIGGWT